MPPSISLANVYTPMAERPCDIRLSTLNVNAWYVDAPRLLLPPDTLVGAGKLWPLLPEELQPSYEIYLISRADPSRDTATQLFLDEIRRRLRALTS